MKKLIISLLVAGAFSSAQAQNSPATASANNPPASNQVLSSAVKSKNTTSTSQVSEIRQKALKELASNYGFSAGLGWQLNKIKNDDLVRSEARLNSLYNFSLLAIEPGILPPVIIEGVTDYAKTSDNEIRISDKTFKIDSLAKFTPVYPTWREYLIFNIPTFELPPESFLPQNQAEAEVWDQWALKGWNQGVSQAVAMVQSSFARLDKDYNGMFLFNILLEQKLVTATVISKQNLGVTGGGMQMSINDQIFKIVEHSTLISDEKKWNVTYPMTHKDAQGKEVK